MSMKVFLHPYLFIIFYHHGIKKVIKYQNNINIIIFNIIIQNTGLYLLVVTTVNWLAISICRCQNKKTPLKFPLKTEGEYCLPASTAAAHQALPP